MKKIFALISVGLILFSCSSKDEKEQSSNTEVMKKYADDPHSFAKPNESRVKHLTWDVELDFDQKIIRGLASYQIESSDDAKEIVLDTRGLQIEKVGVFSGSAEEIEAEFSLGEEKEFLGRPLVIKIDPTVTSLNIYYSTSPGAAALQWLDPEQTAGKKFPFLFTQSQAILARTWLPCQDSPGIRFTYNAKVKAPEGMLVLMSAENPTEKTPNAVYEFQMKQAVPAYLMALSAGDLEFESVGERTGVYAEPSMIEASAYEFAEMEDMLIAAEKLYGKYAWERYDLIVLPPSFPFGGMENPRLTFATPTIIAGDRSLTALVAHELAHSWSGNLVTNSTWDDFWLNEGFTVYFERRIMESLYGEEYADMLEVLGYQDLSHTLEDLASKPNDTKLKLALGDRDPDDGMTDIAYEKGYFFLRSLEDLVGRERFDKFLKNYFQSNAFDVMTTEEFVEYLNTNLLSEDTNWQANANIDAWLYKPGLPEGFEAPKSGRFERVEKEMMSFLDTKPAKELETSEWSTHEWLHFLRKLPRDLSDKQMIDLDESFGFTKSGNSEILAAWFQLTIRNNYEPANTALDSFLVNVGRRKFLTPTYKALKQSGKLEIAKDIYARARPNYHSVSRNSMDELLGWD
jgi:leukotriene-A4 hydrolase